MATASASTTGTTSYVYDGEGRRVQKTVAGVTTTMVYDALGRLAMEDSNQQLTNRGQLPTAGTVYRIQDALGSTWLLAGGAGDLKR